MGKNKNRKKNSRTVISYDCTFPLQILIAAAPFLMGVFEEYISAVISACLLAFIFICAAKNKVLVIRREPLLIASGVIELFFILSPIWAVDQGMAALGAVKFLPVLLFVILLHQRERSDTVDLLKFVPHSGVVMTGLSFILSLIPALKPYMLVSGRLAGFFEYSNTFAIYLLIGIILLMYKKERRLADYIGAVILSAGIFLSGSRTVFILFIAAAAVFVIREKDRRIKILSVAAVLVMIGATVLYSVISGNFDVIGRYLTSSFSSSTLLGRFLYYDDAIPQILRHPLGFGYLGYRTMQGSFQTGVYSIVHVHNDLLQIFLDIGWVPGIAAIAAVVYFIRKKPLFRTAAAATALLLHSLFDFDLQFVSMCFILCVLLYTTDRMTKSVEIKPAPVVATASVLCAVSLYFGAADALAYFHKDDAALKIYPGYTDSWVTRLQQSTTMEDYDSISDHILQLNRSCSLAYSAKARAAFSRGDIMSMISYKNKAIELSRYELNEYIDYFDMLRISASMFEEAGDTASEEYCLTEILRIPNRLSEVESNTSAIAWKINDVPELELPEEYQEFISTYING